MKINKGFTLIELMIVVAIIGILSMIAMPAYQTYTKKTYVSEGLSLFSSIKLAVIENYSVNGVAAATDFVDLGFAGAQLTQNNTRLMMSSPLKYIDMETVPYNDVTEKVNRFTLVYNDKVGKLQNELVMEIYPAQKNKDTGELTVQTLRTYCVSYLKTKPNSAIPKKYLPGPCKPSKER